MAEFLEAWPDGGPSRGSTEPLRHEWARLLRCTTPEDAVAEIASWMRSGGEGLELLLDAAGTPPPDPARHGPRREAGPDSVVVRGAPEWRLRARKRSDRPLGTARLREAALALEAWRAARSELERTEAGFAARTRELDFIQSLARVSADADSPDRLFEAVAATLHRGGWVDAVLVAHAFSGSAEVRAFVARPFRPADLESAAASLGGPLGWEPGPRLPLSVHCLDPFDPLRGSRCGLRREDLVVVPLLRRGVPIAALGFVPTSPVAEEGVRLFFGAANQVSLHLDRILAVREAEQGRFRSILDSMPQAVILTDSGLRVLQANPAAERLLGGLGLAGPGRILDRVGPLDLGELVGPVLRKQSLNAAAEVVLDAGSILDLTVSAAGARPDGFVLVLRDVTERRKLQDQLAQSEKLSSLGQMISGIAHELNNPLASVLGYAQLIQSGRADDRLGRRLEVVLREARRCQKIVHNLLSFARRHKPERGPLSLNEVVDSVLALMEYQLRVDGIRVTSEKDPSIPPIHGDFHQLQQALLNLVTNAQHALRSRDGGGSVSIRTRRLGCDRVALEVEDDGPGVPEGLRSRIFDPFFTTKDPGHGTGLGLSIVYGIVTSHEGTIRLEGGVGARFRIELPAGVGDAAGRRAEAPPIEEPAQAQRARILVVDDEEPIARLISETLAQDGHEVTTAHDGRDALERLALERYDLIVSDLRMPGMTLERLREEMERLRPGLSTRLVLTTGDTVSREPEAVAERAGLRILHKPFDLDDLRRVVRSWLASHRERGPCGT